MTGPHVEEMSHIFQSTIYLMGISFILGSLFTIFVLLALDYMQQRKQKLPGTDLRPPLK